MKAVPPRFMLLASLLLASCDPGVPADPSDAATPTDDAAAPGLISHDVRIIVEPSDGGAMLVSAITSATTSVHMTMYLLSDNNVVNALVAAHRRGLDVRVVLNRSFPTGGSTNDAVFTQLASAGVGVHWASTRYTLTHEKCLVIDGREAWIMTMNATMSSPSNREYLAVDHDAVDVLDADAIFEADYAGNAYPSYAGPLVVAPLNAANRLFDLITHATRSIDVEDEELSDNTIVNAIIGAHVRGLTVRVVLASGTLTPAQQTAVTNMMGAGVPVHYRSSPTIHAKAIVADGALAYVGSINLTTASIQHNRELGLITDNAAAVTLVQTTIAADFNAGRSF